jgi:hypothetical protein
MSGGRVRDFWFWAFGAGESVTYACLVNLPGKAEAMMNSTNPQADDSAFPAVFVVVSTFIGALVWLCVMLAGLPQN